jgi:HlyD family secretion protein
MMTSWFCGFAWLAAVFCDGGVTPTLTGYIEGEQLFVAPTGSARIVELLVTRGDTVTAGDPIAQLETTDADFALQSAQSLLAESQARLDNLTTGKRSEEIAVLEAARTAARTELKQTELDLTRARDLVRRGMQSQSALDSAQTRQEVASSKVREVEANLKVAGIAARLQEIEAARQVVAARQTEVDRARWLRDERTVVAPVAGVIEEIIRYVGEQTSPGAPIATLLSPERKKLRLFVPEQDVSRVHLGDSLQVSCDGCVQGLVATIDFVAGEPEFTPPVLYSVANRQRLVVLVEARLEGDAVNLKSGQIVDVTWPSPT